MPFLHWQGKLEPGPLLAAIKRSGWSITSELPKAQARVLTTAGLESLPSSKELPFVWMPSRAPGAELMVQAVLRGAYDVIGSNTPGAARRLEIRLKELGALEAPPGPEADIVAGSDAAKRNLAQIRRAARTSMPVLITGETGSGKELAARLIHRWSARGSKPFVPINCAAIPNELMEAELFGYAKGAFSGATRSFDGQLMAASGGTVFLDEIDDTPLSTQVKLLRVLEDRVVTRLGESEPHRVDFRLVAATNRDLRGLIAKGSFGQDFYERLAIVAMQLAPLRERKEDLPELCAHFIGRFYREEPATAHLERVQTVSPEALHALAQYPWPGNIRELRNVLFEALVYKRSGSELLVSDLPRRVLLRKIEHTGQTLVDPQRVAEVLALGNFNLRAEVENLERIVLEQALARSGGNAAQAAKLLGEVGRGNARDPGGTVRAMMRRLLP